MEENNQISSLSARETAVRTLMAVTLKNRPFDSALDDMATEAGLDTRDRAFVFNLLMVTLRRYGNLKALLGTLLTTSLPKNATWTEAALITGLAQIILLRTADYAAVNETVTLIKNLPGKEKGFAGLVNAVLRRATREQTTLSKKINRRPALDLPNWLFKSWAETYSQDTANKIATTLQQTPTLDLTIKSDEPLIQWAKKLEATLTATGSLRLSSGNVTILEGYEEGSWWVQDMAAAIPATLLGDIKGKHVLDLCAAPGGKTMQLASKGAQVTSVDRSKNRLKRLHANLERTGLQADIHCADAAVFEPAKPVDHILLDAPCSATGTLRRNPDVIWTKGPNDVGKLAVLQARVLDHAFSLLPEGGSLVYCVCSLQEAEGIAQIRAFLERQPLAERVTISSSEVGGLTDLVTKDGDLLCLPHYLADQGGMDGFFVARLTRKKTQ